MNSSLQSLLALEEFIGDIVSMQKVWSFVPEAQLLRTLVDIKKIHTSTDPQRKRLLLFSFKKTVSDQAPAFRSNLQNDAYEFLTTVLAHMRGLSPLLHKVASHLGTRYTCPVESHLVFKMDITRMCKSCDIRSLRQEEFTNLSLDLIPEATVEQMLQLYLTETQLEYKCNCGGTESAQRFSFATLPEVLLLHLKRFRCTSVCKLEKANDPIRLPANMVVYTRKGNVQYSLISSISHFGVLELGHYICDSVHPGTDLGESSDRWLTFNDSQVCETSGSHICKERQHTAYILFYKKQGVQERWTDEPHQDVET
ncbi:ubiquitin carboxyl-terminal hydrolase 29-like [Nelusetta ayraudi]|uniref:ubiquitin carboxyl-terminal hydrolase 29-like n=1 Tax=Nelusetta ayraudi TaxID=303726 RepID=UPI003F712689